MLMNSVLNEGVAGMHHSQKKMLQAAQDIVKAGVPRDNAELNPNATGAKPATDAGASVSDLPAAGAVEANSNVEKSATSYSAKEGDVVGSLLEQKRQQFLFDASASVVETANEAMGSLIDDLS